MSNKITKEILAKAIDATKDTVKTVKVDKTFELEINGKPVKYQVVNKSQSDKNNQLNALALAPVVNGKPDYNNVCVVYAGTNMPGETGDDGFDTALGALGGLSGEYQSAKKFLNETQKKIAKNNGTITDVAGFSQSAGYMMKMAAEYGAKYGFKTTSFDDWGYNQFDTLTAKEKEWLKKHPEMLVRYQNDSWADGSGRDHKYGDVNSISGIGFNGHNTLAKYWKGDYLDLDALAKDGIFAPNMTKAQVAEAARKWAYNRRDKNAPSLAIEAETEKRIKEYLKIYGSYGSSKDISGLSKYMKSSKNAKSIFGHTSILKMSGLGKIKIAGSGGVSSFGKIFLDSDLSSAGTTFIDEAIEALKRIEKVNNHLVEDVREIYDRNLEATMSTWSWILDSYDVESEAYERQLQPEHHINQAEVDNVSRKLTAEIKELTDLKQTLKKVVANRVAQDKALANTFGF
ncbi:hypothetical protein RyT2_12170 [Pseudolactococcus yaeyamensis]